MVGLHDKTDNWVTGEKEMEKVAVDYFSDLFTTTSPDDFTDILEGIPAVITETDNALLMRPASEEEVRAALFLMNPEKAPDRTG
ncbi:unnamed protein product [Microthlaspi erraticum]|uniref:Uncharacterized protein n=1 Tax=Microthlaspi erraticum TaxID=1685480 RepID=A0A6D2JYA7_9BRAS|nr:unnamed protein product [Microthlaspi erraticum]